MKGSVLWPTCFTATWLVMYGLVFHGLIHAQTIESQDTRTFQDSRGQDSRQSPALIPPSEAERLKKLTEEATVPDETKGPTSADNNKENAQRPSRDIRPRPPDKRN